MDIQKIDKNFAIKTDLVEDGVRYYPIPHPDFALYGVYYDEERGKFARLNKAVADATNEGVAWLSTHTSGGRVRFSTNSTRIAIRVKYDALGVMSHMTIQGQGGFMLLRETANDAKLVRGFMPTFDQQKGFEGSVECNAEGEMLNYILYFPLYNDVKSLEIGLDENASVGQGRVYRGVKPILYYGSSITQGGCASRPDNAYQALIAKWNNIDFINLGFSGSALGETVMVDYLATVDCSLFVCDYDHNAPTAEHLDKTHYALYERYRAVRKDTPILFLTRPDYKGTQFECKKREQIVRATYERAKAQGDKNVYFIAGRTFFTTDRQNCTVDGCHPNDLGFYRMAKKIYAKMKEIDGIFR